MEDDTITKMLIICTIFGLVLLTIISEKLEISQEPISAISIEKVNKQTTIQGYVRKILNKNTITELELEDKTGKIKVIIFSKEKIKAGSLIKVEGKIAKYNNELQVYAEKILVLN